MIYKPNKDFIVIGDRDCEGYNWTLETYETAADWLEITVKQLKSALSRGNGGACFNTPDREDTNGGCDILWAVRRLTEEECAQHEHFCNSLVVDAMQRSILENYSRGYAGKFSEWMPDPKYYMLEKPATH